MQYFITAESLRHELKDADIRAALRTTDLQLQHHDEIVKRVMSGGLRTFAILVNIQQIAFLSDFIKKDEFQPYELDQRLPLQSAELERILGKAGRELAITRLEKTERDEAEDERLQTLKDELADIVGGIERFWDEQFQFSVPSFQRNLFHRRLDDNIRLPFIYKDLEYRSLGSGSYGKVYKETLPGLQFGSPPKTGIEIARKELESGGSETYQKEVQVLEILRLIKHPNILELLCSYTHNGIHNLLFPLAGENVSDLTKNDRDKVPIEFRSDDSFFVALCGLVDGLSCVHHYTNEKLDLNLIGCHHDIKPDNFLVKRSRFILADFGISSIKTEDEGSTTDSKGGAAYYSAPESRDFNKVKELRIGRASDIWSLGCIFAVILTYLKQGPAGIATFEDKREGIADLKGQYTVYKFHLGPNRPNPAVSEWLDSLRVECTASEQAFLDLIRDMLRLEPLKRPKIGTVLTRLRMVTLQKLCEGIADSISQAPETYRNRLAFEIETTTLSTFFDELNDLVPPPFFDIWFTTPSEPNPSVTMRCEDVTVQALCDDTKFDYLASTLRKLGAELDSLKTSALDPETFPVFLPLQKLDQQLLFALPPGMRESLHSRMEVLILAKLDSDKKMTEAELDAVSSSHTRILQLMNIKNMKKHAENFSESSLRLDVGDFEQSKQYDGFRIPFFTFEVMQWVGSQGTMEKNRDVLVEKLGYGKDIQDDMAGQQIFNRMLNILHLPEHGAKLRGLECSGFYRDKTDLRIVYKIPDPPTASDGAPNTAPRAATVRQTPVLRTFMQVISENRASKVSLTSRFRLATELATAVLEFHKIGWLHKGISSHNVIFVTTGDGTGARNLRSPFITGFSHSRPDDPNQFSNLPEGKQGEVLRNYLHPKYQNNSTRYVIHYDYYSLGLVLLEIGAWKPLADIIKESGSENLSPERISTRLKTMAEKSLPSTMGVQYSKAVLSCLSNELESKEPESSSLKFEQRVLRVLISCSV